MFDYLKTIEIHFPIAANVQNLTHPQQSVQNVIVTGKRSQQFLLQYSVSDIIWQNNFCNVCEHFFRDQ